MATIRDNDVYFNLPSGYNIISGKYVVTGSSVTGGQPSDVRNGSVLTCGGDGKFRFRVGRKGSGAVASWFNGQVDTAKNTTFGHAAGNLNFAFIGNLELTVQNSGVTTTYKFNDVVLAQGKSGSSNNWWFGGKNCHNIGNSQVDMLNEGATAKFTCQRGDNDVSQVSVTEVLLLPKQADFDTAKWMEQLLTKQPNIKLNQIMMPGSHDAGMSQLSHCSSPEGTVKTQELKFDDQLKAGSRYFDIRVDFDYDQLVTYHRTSFLGCNGQALEDIFNQAKAFLDISKSEVIIFKISHIRDYSPPTGHTSVAEIKRLTNEFLDKYDSILYKNTKENADGTIDTTINIAKETLKSLKGKVIVVCDYDEYIDTARGRFRYHDVDHNENEVSLNTKNIAVLDDYSNTDDYNTMSSETNTRGQLYLWNKFGGLNKDYLFLLSWTLTGQTNTLNTKIIKTLADEANSHLQEVLQNQISNKNWSKPNIVYIDFVDANLCKTIINYNF